MDRLKSSTKKIVTHPFFSGSVVMIVGSNFANVIAYIYHIVFARMLTISAYGNLAAYLAMLGILGTILSFLGLVIVKFVASTERKDLPALMNWFAHKVFYVLITVSIFVLIFSKYFSTAFKMPLSMVLLIIPSYIFLTILLLQRSFLQGLMKFKALVFGNNIHLALRLLIGVIFVWLGWSGFGASLGIALAALVSIAFYWQFLKEFNIFKAKSKFKLGKEVIKYSVPLLITSVGSTLLLNIDLLMVKYYFDVDIAGKYAAITVLGKIIFYATAPVAAVMFPMISERYSQKKNYLLIFLLSLILSASAGIFVTLVYFYFPNLAILPLYGSKYIDIKSYIALYAVFISLYSIANLVINFYQSTDRPRIGILLVFAVIAQIVSILLFHDTIIVIIQNLIVVMAATVISLFGYLFYDLYKHKYEKN